MKFSYKWLNELVDFDKSPVELADDLSAKSVEVESIEQIGGNCLCNVVVGEIMDIKPHPNADKLQVVIVDANSPDGLFSVVCGAPNINIGQKIALALPGAKLTNCEIKESEIRGVLSSGMICAQDELGLGDDHQGVLEISKEIPNGSLLSEIYSDYILDGAVLSNRGDLQNHFGLSREISAIYDIDLKKTPTLIIDTGDDIAKMISVKNQDFDACPQYSARVIRNIVVAPSPEWLRCKLSSCGIKSINNVVDITNYIMLLYGNPLHAFDYDKLAKKDQLAHIEVRLSNENEKITTIDDIERVLPQGLITIADHNGPIAIGGVMGGKNSEIDLSTKTIVLESATFNQAYIRRAQHKLGLKTEASSRFEKGLAPYLAGISLDEAAKMIADITGGEIVRGKISSPEIYPVDQWLDYEFEKIKDYLALDISKSLADNILIRLGFELDQDKIKPPFWRLDISIWQDIAEEIGRIYGLDKTQESDLKIDITPKTTKKLYFQQAAISELAKMGLTQVYTYSILSKEFISITGMDKHFFEVINPLDEDASIIRAGLWPGLLRIIRENSKRNDSFCLFDLSEVYLPSNSEKAPSNEELHLAIAFYGLDEKIGFYALRKVLDQFMAKFKINLEYINDNSEKEYAQNGRNATIHYNKQKIGRICEIHPQIRDRLDIANRIWMLEINIETFLDDVLGLEMKFQDNLQKKLFKPFSKFEVSKRDLAIIIDEEIPFIEVEKAIKSVDSKIVDIALFDEYKSEKIGIGKKSMAFHLILQAEDHTLGENEISNLLSDITSRLKSDFEAKLRDI